MVDNMLNSGSNNGNGFADVGQGFGNLFTGNLDWQRQQITNAFNASEAQKQRDWETDLSNTSYQRAVADMQKAGLNPYLAYNQGGASTPSGATGHGSYSGTRGGDGWRMIGTMIGAVVGSAMRVAQTSMNNATQIATQSMRNNSAYRIATMPSFTWHKLPDGRYHLYDTYHIEK